jgi:hypothetical protein
MKPSFRCYFWIFIFMVTTSCPKPIDHDPVLAGKKAVEFVRLAFVRQNDENAYALLSDSTRRYVPLDKFKETLSRLRPGTRPSKITATEYEPMPGEKAIYVYVVVGENPDRQSDYTVTMEGTASTDYRVSKITRGVSYIPSTTEKKKFNPPIS